MTEHDFKQAANFKLKEQADLISDSNNETKHNVELTKTPYKQEVPIKNSSFDTTMLDESQLKALAVGLFFVVVVAVVCAINFMSASRNQNFSAESVVKFGDLAAVANKSVLVKVEGIAANALDSHQPGSVVFQKLRIVGPSRYGRVCNSVSPSYFLIRDRSSSILIDGSALAEFASERESNLAEIVPELFKNEQNKEALKSPLAKTHVWSIKSGDRIVAIGQVVWSDQFKSYVLVAPSAISFPLSGGLIQLKAANGLHTY